METLTKQRTVDRFKHIEDIIDNNWEKALEMLRPMEGIKPHIAYTSKSGNTEVWFWRQNPNTGSRWAKLSRDRNEVTQFVLKKYNGNPTFVWLGVCVNGEIIWY